MGRYRNLGCVQKLVSVRSELRYLKEAPLPHSPRTISFLTPSVLCFAYTATEHVLFFTETMSTQEFKQAPHKLLVIPGPIEVADDVLFANAHPAMSHVSPDFIPVFGDCIRMLREVLFAPTAQPVLTAGSGTDRRREKQYLPGCARSLGQVQLHVGRIAGHLLEARKTLHKWRRNMALNFLKELHHCGKQVRNRWRRL